MSKYYQRGKFKNSYILLASYNWRYNGIIGIDTTQTNTNFADSMGARGNFVKALIVRGIGYRVFALTNDFLNPQTADNTNFITKTRPVYSKSTEETDSIIETNDAVLFDFPYSRYILIRAGHTCDLLLPLKAKTWALTSKKDRKLALNSPALTEVTNTAKKIFYYRTPSVYTGRGVRIKHAKPIRKAGKKDKQKGKSF